MKERHALLGRRQDMEGHYTETGFCSVSQSFIHGSSLKSLSMKFERFMDRISCLSQSPVALCAQISNPILQGCQGSDKSKYFST